MDISIILMVIDYMDLLVIWLISDIISQGEYMIEQWLKDVKMEYKNTELGMILVHNGIVRSMSKDGKTVRGMHLSYDKEKLNKLIKECQNKDGIITIRVWINEGKLVVGDDIMYVLVAGRFRTDVLPVFEHMINVIKRDVIEEKELI